MTDCFGNSSTNIPPVTNVPDSEEMGHLFTYIRYLAILGNTATFVSGKHDGKCVKQVSADFGLLTYFLL